MRILISNKYVNLPMIDYLVWLTLATNCGQKKNGCAYIPLEKSSYVGVRNDYFTMPEEKVDRYIYRNASHPTITTSPPTPRGLF